MFTGRSLKFGVLYLLLITLIVTAMACARGVGGTAVNLAEEMPEGAVSYVYLNSGALSGDQDLHPLRDKWKAANEAWLAEFAIGVERVQHFSLFAMQQSGEGHVWQFSLPGENTLIVRGDFDLEQMRDQLRTQDRHRGDWKKIELWESADATSWLAMPPGSLIGGDPGNVRGCIDVIEGDKPSLYSNPDFRDVLDELPDGIMVNCYRYPEEPPYSGLLSSGASLRKKNSTTMRVDLSYKFSSPDNAGNALEAIRDAVDLDYNMVDAEVDGRFVKVTAEVDIDDLAVQ